MLIKAFFILVIFALSAAADVSVVFDTPNQTWQPGQTLSFYGTIYNNGPDVVEVNSFNYNLVSPPGTLINFFSQLNFPTIAAGANTGSVLLFDVEILQPYPAPGTQLNGSYTLLGGPDVESSFILSSTPFSVTVGPYTSAVPEPSAWGATLTLSAAVLLLRRRRQPNSSVHRSFES
ncbi:hypothetical protein F183_A12660 [Bryobacterales bacterium F-183]|nr:hypothetical protein F183_A12660 [Bryobacterales bacterium F-183]